MTEDRRALRRHSIPRFVETMAERHPELRREVGYDDMLRMAEREGVTVCEATFPPQQRARTIRFGKDVFIQLRRGGSRSEHAVNGMHELCHIWRDDPGVSTYYSDELTGGSSCQFADLFAWYVTSGAREFFDPAASQHTFNLE